jgi:CheY-like chemotaxis protein
MVMPLPGGVEFTAQRIQPVKRQKLLTKMRQPVVMIVEQDDRVSRVLCRMIKRLGHQPYTAADYEAFKTIYIEKAPAIILLNLELAGNHNSGFCRYLVERQSRAAIILLSNMEEEETSGFMKLGQSAGLNMRGVLRKPVDMDALKDLLAGLTPSDPLKKSHDYRLIMRADDDGTNLDRDQRPGRWFCIRYVPCYLLNNRKTLLNRISPGVIL